MKDLSEYPKHFQGSRRYFYKNIIYTILKIVIFILKYKNILLYNLR